MGTALARVSEDRERAFQSGRVITKDDTYVLNHTTKYLARENTDERHGFGQYQPGDPRAKVCEAWRFPIVDGHYDASDPAESYNWNEVTFVYAALRDQALPGEIAVVGTFAPMYAPIALRRIADMPIFTATVLVPKGEVHAYQFIVDGTLQQDPVNPQKTTLDNGREWSRFFTQGCTGTLSFESWEIDILTRLTDHILPFHTMEGQKFLSAYYESLDKASRESQYPGAYRFDESVGVANFIDKLVAREENHHLIDYKTCLGIVNRLLRQRNPYVEPKQMDRELYVEIYDQMATGQVPGWDYGQYDNPRYFLQLLRRHTITGAFAHPKYCGNAGATGWAYVAERYRDPQTRTTLFDWRKNLEPPLGTNEFYRG
jgi:Gluconate 2-dehydrogenase subunit 3